MVPDVTSAIRRGQLLAAAWMMQSGTLGEFRVA